MQLRLIDLHSDTASELHYRNKDLKANDLHVSLDKAGAYTHYAQVFAVYTSKRLSDEDGYKAFFNVEETLRQNIERYRDLATMVCNGESLERAWKDGRAAAILAIEDSRILNGHIERVRELYDHGVRFMTLTWAGESCIGGAWDTTSGLTEFGKEAVREAFRLGIVPDVSHASVAQIDDVIALASEAGKPFVATHSNAYGVYPHGRNLLDRHFRAICESGGLVGMNMYRAHLTDTKMAPATLETVYRHIDHFMELGGQDTVCFGCDFDGASFPDALSSVADIAKIAEVLASHGYSEELIEKIFWKNAYHFIQKYV